MTRSWATPSSAPRRLIKTFGTVEALKGVDLEVEKGAVYGLLGPNGAGKTTAVRILTTLLQPTSGRAEVDGLDSVRDAEELRFRIGLAGQSAAVDENLTGLENLELVGRLYHLPRRRPADAPSRSSSGSTSRRPPDRPAKTYSGGMRRRLDLAASLVGRPDVLFLDEPTTGLDPRSRIDVWEFIRELQSEGTTILLTTQYLEEADQLADRIARDGRRHDHRRGNVRRAEGPDRRRGARAARPGPGRHRSRRRGARGTWARENPSSTRTKGQVRIPVHRDGAAVLLDSVRRLDEAHIALADIALHRPTLDDVFLSLTGRGAEHERDPELTAPAGSRSAGAAGGEGTQR